MNPKQIFLSVVKVAVAMFVCAVLGVMIGVSLGANTINEANCQVVNGKAICTETHSFVYLGQPGYEGGGLLGLHIGLAAGLLVGLGLVWKKSKKGVNMNS